MARASPRRRGDQGSTDADGDGSLQSLQSKATSASSTASVLRESKRARSKSSISTTNVPTQSASRKRASSSSLPLKARKRASSKSESGGSSHSPEDEDNQEDEEDELTDLEEEEEQVKGGRGGASSQNWPASTSLLQSRQSGTMGAPTLPTSGISITGVKIRRGGGNRKGTAPEARAIHNATERARRESITNRIHILGDTLPSLNGIPRPGKPRIITEALTFVNDAQAREKFYKRHISHLSEENERLQKMIDAASKGEELEVPLESPPSPYSFKQELFPKVEEASGSGVGSESGNRNRNISNASNSSAWIESGGISGLAMSLGLPPSMGPRNSISYHPSSGGISTPGYSPSGSSMDLPQSHPMAVGTPPNFAAPSYPHSYPHGFDEHSRRASIAAPGYHPHYLAAASFYHQDHHQHPYQQQQFHHSQPHFSSRHSMSSYGGGSNQNREAGLLLQRHLSGDSPAGSSSSQPLPSSYPHSPVTSSNPQDSPSYPTSNLAGQSYNDLAGSQHQHQFTPHERSRSEAGINNSMHYLHFSTSPNMSHQGINHPQAPLQPSPLSRSKEIEEEEDQTHREPGMVEQNWRDSTEY